MNRATRPWLAAGLIGLSVSAPAAWADAIACSGFKWNVQRELDLFAETAVSVKAAAAAPAAPTIEVGRLYEAVLRPQEEVRFAAAPSKKMLVDGAFAGLMRFRVPSAGRYRVALGRGFWVDVVAGAKTLPSQDFGGVPGCDAPRKIVIYELPAGEDLLLQLGADIESSLRVAIIAEADR